MKVLLWHGYLLTGSGSNVLTANVARAWRAAGHDVLALCQDRSAGGLDFVDAVVDARSGDAHLTGAGSAAGRLSVMRPDIGPTLPVYVLDAYEGFTAKLFVDLTEKELDDYVDRNVRALKMAIEAHGPDAIFVGHEVMGPAIARAACEATGRTYAVQLHGSGLEYAVKRQERYRKHAAHGLGGAAVVIGGSGYMLEAARSVVGEWPGSSAVVNPGCDVELFNPVARASEPEHPKVAFVGKHIPAKGVQDLLGAISLSRHRPLDLTIVGYGSFEEGLRRIADAMRAGDPERARRIAGEHDDGNLVHFTRFLSEVTPAELGRFAQVRVEFTGRYEHDRLSAFLPTVDVLVVPSVVPEAFGMVAAEAAACGVLPIVPSHSGIAEAGSSIEEAIGKPGLLTYDASDPIRSLALAIDRVLDIPFRERIEMGRAARELALRRWSWHVVGERLLQAAVSG